MRSCEDVLELISAALDGALTGEEQAALDEHLSHCPACSALFDELRSLHTAAAALEEVSAPAGFAGQVMARIAADPAQEQPDKVVPLPVKRRSRTPWKAWAATAAVVAVVALGAVTLPGQFGAGTQMDSTADCAAPAQAESAGADFSAENGPAAFFSLPPEENKTASSAPRMGDGAAAPESPDASIGTLDTAPEEMPEEAATDEQYSPIDPSAAYCGVLTLTGEPLPEGLENYDATEDESGSLTYVVPADFFSSCLARLEEDSAANFTYDVSEEEAAEYGLIIVEVP